MTLWLRAERLFTGAGAAALHGACVALDGGRIGAEARARRPPQPQPGDTVVAVAGGTILPGFIEAHTHLPAHAIRSLLVAVIRGSGATHASTRERRKRHARSVGRTSVDPAAPAVAALLISGRRQVAGRGVGGPR